MTWWQLGWIKSCLPLLLEAIDPHYYEGEE